MLTNAQKLPMFLMIAVLLAAAASSEAEVKLRKRVFAHFPDHTWCPFTNQYDFWFVATTSKADLTLEALPEDLAEAAIKVDRIFVVDQGVFEANFRGGEDEDLVAEGCWSPGIPYFKASAEALSDNRNGWTLVNADITDSTLYMGLDTKSKASAKITLTGLTPGKRYFVTGWSSWITGGSFAVKVDTPRPSSFLLQEGRFRLDLRYDGSNLAGGEVVSRQSAVFWFRDSDKAELIVNITDRCKDKGTYHLQVGGTAATRASVTITDLERGKSVSYQNKQGERFKTRIDQTTFRCQ